MMVFSRRPSSRLLSIAPHRSAARSRYLLAGVAVALIVGSVTATLAATRPPTNLKKVGDHWTPWEPPAAGPDDYIIQKDDTLWDLAGKWLGDPFLWPQVWEQNRYILDSHWIYPGDPLVVPGRPTVVPTDEQPPVGDLSERRDDVKEAPAVEEAPTEVAVVADPLVAAADAADLYCSGYIERFPTEPTVRVARGTSEKVAQGQGDVIYLSAGRDAGVQAGDEYAIIRNTYAVEHPVTEEVLGTFVKRLGKLSVMLVHDQSSTAIIDFSCEDVNPGDAIVPWSDIPIPMMKAHIPFDRWDIAPSDSPGYVVSLIDRLTVVGTGHLIYVDMGQDEGVLPGDMLTLYREPDEPTLPPLKLGQAVVLTVEPETATAKIIQSVQETYIGDRVDLDR